MTRLAGLLGVIVCTTVISATSAAADPVTDWNAIAADTIATGARPPGAAALLDFAMVHVAIHDAVQAFEHRFDPYRVRIGHARGSQVAAVAKAARDVLVNRFPAQEASIHGQYLAYLANHGLFEDDPGVRVGRSAARGIIRLRRNDRSYPQPPPPPDTGGTEPGEWRPTPPAFAPFSAPWLGAVRPFTMKSSDQFRARPHPALTSRRYTRDYQEVKEIGSVASATRTPEQTQLAHFYSDNTIVLWQRTLRGIADARIRRLGDSARLFALANLAAADAGITAWNSKEHYRLWRPVTAIQEGDNDGNPQTVGDRAWMPFLATPPYPDYTSGANNVTASITTILARFFGTDRVTFTMTSNAPAANPRTREYRRFSAAADDVVDVRVYQGIHFRFADEAARREATAVALQAFEQFLRPRHDDDDHHHHGDR